MLLQSMVSMIRQFVVCTCSFVYSVIELVFTMAKFVLFVMNKWIRSIISLWFYVYTISVQILADLFKGFIRKVIFCPLLHISTFILLFMAFINLPFQESSLCTTKVSWSNMFVDYKWVIYTHTKYFLSPTHRMNCTWK